MTDQPSAAGANTGSSQGGAPVSGAPSGGDNSRADGSFQPNPRAQGHSPALEARQQAADIEPIVRLGDAEYRESDVRAALAERAEAQVRKQSLPAAPDKYEIKLTANFQAPAGVNFEFDMNDPTIAEARKVAHARGVDQETFSDMLGVYAATK